MGIFNKILQVESTSQMVWLTCLMNTLDLTLLSKFLTGKCGEIKIALRFQYINTGKYEPNRDEKMDGNPYRGVCEFSQTNILVDQTRITK